MRFRCGSPLYQLEIEGEHQGFLRCRDLEVEPRTRTEYLREQYTDTVSLMFRNRLCRRAEYDHESCIILM